MSTDSTAPDTIVLIHGFWVTPRSWEHWISHYESKGYRVLAPAADYALDWAARNSPR